VAWRQGKVPDIAWQGRFDSAVLFKITKDYADKVFIGVKRGERALRAMPAEEIRSKQWQISTRQAGSQWIPGTRFRQVLVEKRVFQEL
jgi:hypothetical protein